MRALVYAMHGPGYTRTCALPLKVDVTCVLPVIRLTLNSDHFSNPPHVHTHYVMTLNLDAAELSLDCTRVPPPLSTTIFPLSLTHTQKQRHIINNRTLASFLFHPGEKHTVWNTPSSKSCIQIELQSWHWTRYLIA